MGGGGSFRKALDMMGPPDWDLPSEDGPAGRSGSEGLNEQEKALLREVVRPDDISSGFDDIGALEEVKEALREVRRWFQGKKWFTGFCFIFIDCLFVCRCPRQNLCVAAAYRPIREVIAKVKGEVSCHRVILPSLFTSVRFQK